MPKLSETTFLVLIAIYLICLVSLSVGKAEGGPEYWFVDPVAGNKNGSGGIFDPFFTIQQAIERASSGDYIYLKPGDYQLNKDIVVSDMAELHIQAFNPSDPKGRPRLLEWGISLQSSISMIENITITDLIIESSRSLRIIGLVRDITITRTDFLMTGPATESVIKLDRVRLGGYGGLPGAGASGVVFKDCVFDTRDSFTQGISFFSWPVLGKFEQTENTELRFQNVTMRGGSRGLLKLAFENVISLKMVGCSLEKGALVTVTNPIAHIFSGNHFDGLGIILNGNVSRVNITGNTFTNFGLLDDQSALIPRPISVTFAPTGLGLTITKYEEILIANNTFINYTRTSDGYDFGYAAITIGSETRGVEAQMITILHNDFSKMYNPDYDRSTYRKLMQSPKLLMSSEMTQTNASQNELIKFALDQKAKEAFSITGTHAIASNLGDSIQAIHNYYGSKNGPFTCCNPIQKDLNAPRVSRGTIWYPWCADDRCNSSETTELKCKLCDPPAPPVERPSNDGNGSLVVIVVAVTLAAIAVILGITGLYCFTRPKNEYSLVPQEGWTSRLLQSVPDVEALFNQFGVPLIQYEDLILNPIPIGTGSFGSVYDGVLSNTSKVIVPQEMHTLYDGDTLQSPPTSPYGSTMNFFHASSSDFLSTSPTQEKPTSPQKKEKKKKSKKEEPRPIAVKVLNPSITDAYEDMIEFLQEIKIMASIDHPNILKLRGVAIDPTTENIVLVMDLMELGSLDDILFKTKQKLSYSRKLAIATEIGYALHYLHSKEPAICHRDLKPGNVLVSKKWTVKVCDFGSSRVLERKTATMTIKGTPIYLAPESIKNSKFSEKSDVYSYGVTLVELFGEMRAYDDVDGSATNLMLRIATEGLRPTIPPNLPPQLKSLIKRCMLTDPESRPPFTDILEKLAEIRAMSPSDQVVEEAKTESSELASIPK